MAHRRGIQSEILVSLLVVMLTATGMLGAVLLRTQQDHLNELRQLAARALVEEGRSPLEIHPSSGPDLRWWIVGPDHVAKPRSALAGSMALDAAAHELAREAREQGLPLLRAATPWHPIRFAMPLEAGDVAVAVMPGAASPLWVAALLLGDVAVFTAFGAYLFRRRMVRPLQRLAASARAIADGAVETRAPVAGAGEIAEVGTAFNEMTDALESRSAALEKAVADLRESNRRLRRMRAGLDRAERLAAVGRLAAGVAHEVGNPIGALLAFLDLVGRDDGLSDSGRQHLSRAAEQGERVRIILRQLLDFSRPPRASREEFDLLALCRQTTELVKAQRRYERVGFEVRAEEGVPEALADPGIASQILLNLLINAADAVTGAAVDRPAVEITLRPAAAETRSGDSEGAQARRRFDVVECVVHDNGPGIPEEDRERIFDPFFTTKAPGEGTGLGLANAQRFATELGGSLDLRAGEDREPASPSACRAPQANPTKRRAPAPDRALQERSA